MGCRVAVAAGDRHAGLGEALLRADHVHDPLFAAGRVEQPDPVLATVALEFAHHRLGEFVRERTHLRIGRDDVIDGGASALGEAYRQPQLAQHREGLGARDLVNQVQTNEELDLSAGQLAHPVRVPNLLEECSRLRHDGAA